MQIKYSQLNDYLNRSSAPVLMVSGDEPYQHMLAADLFRNHAQELGFTERKVLTVESGFDWSELDSAISNMSLFGDRTLVDLRIVSGKPGVNGSKAVVKFVNDLHEEIKLLIQVPRLDRSAMNSAWVKAIDKTGLVLRVWPLNEAETKNWIKKKLESKGFGVSPEIVSLITQHVEGNLLAAMQEIEKIILISDTKKLDVQTINLVLTNSSHYSLNELIDAITNKNVPRLMRILHGLEKEGVAPPLLLWGITECVRNITEINSSSQAYRAYTQLKPLAQLSMTHQYHIGINNDYNKTMSSCLLKQCAWVDRVIKGRANGNPWHELLQLSIATQNFI